MSLSCLLLPQRRIRKIIMDNVNCVYTSTVGNYLPNYTHKIVAYSNFTFRSFLTYCSYNSDGTWEYTSCTETETVHVALGPQVA